MPPVLALFLGYALSGSMAAGALRLLNDASWSFASYCSESSSELDRATSVFAELSPWAVELSISVSCEAAVEGM